MDAAKAAACTGFERLEGGVRPAKLFIGGITRHTTTKQLRDHFSRYGRVLDCVAMRQPDGRPRGFGYVTLDSPAAADRCLAEPQVIDGRVVDMKRAVPEGSGTPAGSPTAGALGQHPELCMGMRTPHSPLYAWPDSPGSFFGSTPLAGAFSEPSPTGLADHLWSWSGTPMHKAPGEVLDCVELLSRRAPGLQGREAPMPLAEPVSPANADGRGCSGPAMGTLSANAPEFVPAAKAATPKCEPAVALKIMAPAPERPQRSPLGELTNITNIMNNAKKDGKDAIKVEPRRERPTPTPLAIGRVDGDGASPMGTPAGAESKAQGERRPMFLKEVSSMMEIREDTSEEEDNGQGGIASESSGSDEGSGNENADDEVDDVDSPSSSGAWTPGQNLGPLPSVGSADHSRGTCKRCNFFPKGRCQNGADCTFCHYPHDKRKPSRQEKRDRRAARLTHREGAEGGALAMADDQMRSLFSGDQENPDDSMEVDDTTQRTLAYTMLPGMPPVGSVKLPAPLALPGNGSYTPTSAGFPCLPPGLPPPQRGLEMWQPDEEVSPLRLGLPLPAARPSPVLATVPMGPTTPQSVAASTPSAAAAKETCTIGTQTIEDLDQPCPRCREVELPAPEESGGEGQTTTKAKARAGKARRGRTWLREELLRIRGAMESSGALPAKVRVRAEASTAAAESI